MSRKVFLQRFRLLHRKTLCPPCTRRCIKVCKITAKEVRWIAWRYYDYKACCFVPDWNSAKSKRPQLDWESGVSGDKPIAKVRSAQLIHQRSLKYLLFIVIWLEPSLSLSLGFYTIRSAGLGWDSEAYRASWADIWFSLPSNIHLRVSAALEKSTQVKHRAQWLIKKLNSIHHQQTKGPFLFNSVQ